MNESANDEPPKDFYRRRLPHWQPPGAILFVTWRCYGALTESALRKLRREKQKLQRCTEENESNREHALRQGKKLFALSDQLLHTNENQSNFFSVPQVADLMVDRL